ncbi:forespore capture DNA-binding protein RefZ [Ectobacillus antri]|uniref:forespore capture DNA-binding protein RefZ n=1 Tax=Ectobacillus antri TaxID=2486280 RepID=UPI000F5B0505|nr:forespore capture DNA-binding protein RefZ [Ectobacillus antri]
MTCTKQKIIEAAICLFNTKGYHGTSVRDIASEAGVNVANISYYFSGKKGLLEHLVTGFLEGYISTMAEAFEMRHVLSPKEVVFLIVRDILHYQSSHRSLTRFVYRELSLDSILIREIMTTYLQREKYYLKHIIETGREQGVFIRTPFSVFMSQLKGMLSAPYLYPQYISEVLYERPSDEYFTKMYGKEVEKWLSMMMEGNPSPVTQVLHL